ncbi:MAG: septum formation initiator family protein [Firmicutes bacterium]|nr:septum formation initiator family protein [Bacillota bacterium]
MIIEMAEVSAAHKVIRLSAQNRQRRFRFRYLFVFAFLIWGAYVYMFVQRPMLTEQAQQKAQLNQQIMQENAKAAELNQQIQNLHSNKYIAALAEQRYHLISRGEIILVASSSTSGTH